MGLRRWLKTAFGVKSISRKLDRLEETQASLLLKIQETVGRATECSLLNQVSLLNKSSGGVMLHIPGGPKERVLFEITKDGRLCFKRPGDSNRHRRRIFVTTMPKSGTYYIGAILTSLGFENIHVHAGDAYFTDTRWLDDEEYEISGPLMNECNVALSYVAQTELVMPGQYLLGHMSAEVIGEIHEKKGYLLGIRDVRRALVSWVSRRKFLVEQFQARHFNTEPSGPLTAAELGEYLRTEGAAAIYFATECVAMLQDALVVRFEELSARDRIKSANSVLSIAEATGCTEDEVFAALHQGYGMEGGTYSGGTGTARFGAVWTAENEGLFVDLGGDIINEALGYERNYTVSNAR